MDMMSSTSSSSVTSSETTKYEKFCSKKMRRLMRQLSFYNHPVSSVRWRFWKDAHRMDEILRDGFRDESSRKWLHTVSQEWWALSEQSRADLHQFAAKMASMCEILQELPYVDGLSPMSLLDTFSVREQMESEVCPEPVTEAPKILMCDNVMDVDTKFVFEEGPEAEVYLVECETHFRLSDDPFFVPLFKRAFVEKVSKKMYNNLRKEYFRTMWCVSAKRFFKEPVTVLPARRNCVLSAFRIRVPPRDTADIKPKYGVRLSRSDDLKEISINGIIPQSGGTPAEDLLCETRSLFDEAITEQMNLIDDETYRKLMDIIGSVNVSVSDKSLENIANIFSNLKVEHKITADDFSGIFEKMKEPLTQFSKSVDSASKSMEFLCFTIFVSLGVWLSIQEGVRRYMGIALLTLVGLYAAKEVTVYIAQYVKQMRQNSALPQSGVDSAAALIISALHLHVLKTTPDGKKVDALLRMVGEVPKRSAGVDKLVLWVKDLAHNFCNSINESFGTEWKFSQVGVTEIDQWLNRVDKVDFKNFTRDNAILIHSLYREGLALKTTYSFNKSVVDKLAAVLAELKSTFNSMAQRSNGAGSIRMEPLTLMFSGRPGVGKSKAVTYFLLSVMLKVYTRLGDKKKVQALKTDMHKMVYSRSVQQDFWDGYTNQPCVVYDDIGQLKSSPGLVNEFLEIVNNSNCFPAPLHMADISEKSTTFFQSDILMCTTNCRRLHDDRITDMRAVLRRFDMFAYIGPTKEFSKNPSAQLWDREINFDNMEKVVKNGVTVYPFNPNMYSICIADPLTDGSTNGLYKEIETIGWHEAVDRCVEAMIRKKTSFEHDQECFTDFVKGLEKTLEPVTQEEEIGFDADWFERAEEQAGGDEGSSEKHLLPDGEPDSLLRTIKEEWMGDGGFGSLFDTPSESDVDPVIDAAPDRWWAFTRKNVEKVDLTRPEFQVLLNPYIPDIGFLRAATWHEIFKKTRLTRDQLVNKLTVFLSQCESDEEKREAVTRFLNGELDNLQIDHSQYLRIFVTGSPGKHNRVFSACQRLRHVIQTWAEQFAQYIRERPWLKILLISASVVIGLCSVLAIGFGLYKYFEDPVKEQAQMTSSDSRGRPLARTQDEAGPLNFLNIPENIGEWTREDYELHNSVILNEKNPEDGVVEQSGTKDNTGNSLSAIIFMKNMYEVTMGTRRFGYATFIQNYVFMMPNHFRKRALACYGNTDEKMLLTRISNRENQIEVSVDELRAMKVYRENDDLCFGEINQKHNAHRSIVKYFCTKDLPTHQFVAAVDVPNRREGMFGIDVTYTNAVCNGFTFLEGNKVDNGLWYQAFTSLGDCGSLVRKVAKTGHDRFIGMHIGASKRNSLGVRIDRDLLEEALSDLDSMRPENDTTPVVTQMDQDIALTHAPVPGNFGGAYWAPLKVNQAGKSKKQKSVLYGKLRPSNMDLAKLRPYYDGEKMVDPVLTGLKGYGGKVASIDPNILQFAISDFEVQLTNSTMGEHDRSVVSYEMAVEGNPEEDFFSGIPRGTSAGYPLSAEKITKKMIYGSDGPFEFGNVHERRIRQEVDDIITKAKKGQRLVHLFQDFPKDERRPLEKIAQGKTRMISGSPLSYLIACRMYFMRFAVAIMNTRVRNGICVGVNAYGNDWDFLARYLQETGENMIAGDFTGFDKSEVPQVHIAIIHMINRWYGDSLENQRVRFVLYMDLFSAMHVSTNSIAYQFTHCLPSGHMLTTISNSIYNHVAFRYCYIVLHDRDLLSVYSFSQHVRLAVCGDDNAAGVSDEKRKLFNQNSIIVPMKELGLTYTNETKGTQGPDWRNISQISFLKRRFVKDSDAGRYIAPLDLDVIYESPNWTVVGDEALSVTIDIVESAVREASLHPRRTFKNFVRLIKKACEEESVQLPNLDYMANKLFTLESVCMY